MIDYLHNLRTWAPVVSVNFISPIDFKKEIHNILYLFHNNHIDLAHSSRVLTDNNHYGYISKQEAEDMWHLSTIYSERYGHSLLIIRSSFVKCTITNDQMIDINKKRNSLLKEIKIYKIIKDMCKITSIIISKKINKTINWDVKPYNTIYSS